MKQWVGTLVLLAALLCPVSGRAQSTLINLTLACGASEQMIATVRNVGTEDTAVIFGTALGNGRKYMVDRLALRVTAVSGSGDEYLYHPKHYPSGIAGRADDWVVPLPVAASYTLTLIAADFIHVRAGRLDRLPEDAPMVLYLPLRSATPAPNPDVAGLRMFRIWTGNGALTSNEVVNSRDCR